MKKIRNVRKRRRIAKEIEEKVLLLCRRRCCICYGLTPDRSIKKGQIAHLDHNPGNNALDNLVYLCLQHHDEYDSRTSQTKNFTMNEVRAFRKELHEAIDQIWKQPSRFDVDELDPLSKIAGHYIREGKFESAEIDVRYLGNGRLRVQGLALWGTTREYGPNIGELEFETELRNGKAVFRDEIDGKVYTAEIRFHENGLTVSEGYAIGYFGMNVSFAGDYVKARASSSYASVDWTDSDS